MEEILDLCIGMDTVSFAGGEFLFTEGRQNGLLYILISGAVEVSKNQTPFATIREPGSVFGDLSILLDQPHIASVEAIEECSCFVTSGGRDFLERNPKLALAVAGLLAMRLKGMISYLADLKSQYGDRNDHLGMVDELLLNLAHRTPKRP